MNASGIVSYMDEEYDNGSVTHKFAEHIDTFR